LGSNRAVDLARGEADLAVRVTPTTDPDLKVRVLGKFPIALFASPTYLRARGLPRTVAQLAGHDVLLPSGDLDALPEARWLRERPGVRIAFRSSSLPALAVRAGLAHHLRVGEVAPGLEHVMELETIPARPTWLVMHPDVAQRAAVRVVADRIASSFRAVRR
jgi:DNA-binding transcriptional LysR family regulator